MSKLVSGTHSEDYKYLLKRENKALKQMKSYNPRKFMYMFYCDIGYQPNYGEQTLLVNLWQE